MSDFDQMGIVVDWVDACRKGDLAALLDLYADDAHVECTCNGTQRYRGRSELEAYWQPRLSAFSSVVFGRGGNPSCATRRRSRIFRRRRATLPRLVLF
ncbi:hypothetical protein ACVWWO_004074 [Bradyrhizobium sp. F1.13.1]